MPKYLRALKLRAKLRPDYQVIILRYEVRILVKNYRDEMIKNNKRNWRPIQEEEETLRVS